MRQIESQIWSSQKDKYATDRRIDMQQIERYICSRQKDRYAADRKIDMLQIERQICSRQKDRYAADRYAERKIDMQRERQICSRKRVRYAGGRYLDMQQIEIQICSRQKVRYADTHNISAFVPKVTIVDGLGFISLINSLQHHNIMSYSFFNKQGWKRPQICVKFNKRATFIERKRGIEREREREIQIINKI